MFGQINKKYLNNHTYDRKKTISTVNWGWLCFNEFYVHQNLIIKFIYSEQINIIAQDYEK